MAPGLDEFDVLLEVVLSLVRVYHNMLSGSFTNIDASWPGSTHDSHVFRTSRLHDFLQSHNRSFEDGILLGDSG